MNRDYKGFFLFIVFFTFVMLIFLWDVMVMRSGFLHGDYFSQFYPWSKIYSDAVKNLTFPYWTRYIQSGFPLMAEGQIGGYYPLNFAFFYFLPFKTAYNYVAVFHFMIAGVFTYLYTRKLGACRWGGFLGALVFCFGSAAAGCFYNTVTLKTLAWFPLVLFLFEGYFDDDRGVNIFIAGIVLGIQCLAGFIQIAVYSAAIYALYYFYGLHLRGRFKMKGVYDFFMMCLTASVIYVPQFLLSWPLAKLSGRANASLDFALWGSFFPLKLIGAVFPYIGFHGRPFYIGLLSLLFLFTALRWLRSEFRIRPILLVFVVALLLAMGEYNPLYVLALKLTRFYSFRNPSKFLFFGVFASSVLAGWGFTSFFEEIKRGSANRESPAFIVFISAMICAFFAAKASVRLFSERIMQAGAWYVKNFVYGREFHKHDIQTYMEKLEILYQRFADSLSLNNPLTVISLVLCAVALITAYISPRMKRLHFAMKAFCILVILADIYVFNYFGPGFRGNIKDYGFIEPEKPVLLNILLNDNNVYRILPYGIASKKLPKWAMPNSNSLYKIDSVAAYTPLVMEIYKKRVSSLEIIDDSLGLKEPAPGALGQNGQMVRYLNVRYVISADALTYDFLDKIAEEDGVFLYRVKDALPRGFMVRSHIEGLRAEGDFPAFTEYGEGYAAFRVEQKKASFLVFSETYYPGWKAYVDGREEKIGIFSGILMKVYVPPGQHEIRFEYFPYTVKHER